MNILYWLVGLLHIWFISSSMASVGLMHNLSNMMVIPYSAGDATQLEMPAECACMRTRHTKTYSDYRVYKSMNVPVLENTSFSSITISTGYELGAHCNLYSKNTLFISYDLRASKTLTYSQPSLFISRNTITIHHYTSSPS
jgi:hypothetical protein